MTFDPGNSATWPEVLTLDQAAAIYRTTPEAIRHALKASRARVCPYPKPFLRYPMRWQRSAICRHLAVIQREAVTA